MRLPRRKHIEPADHVLVPTGEEVEAVLAALGLADQEDGVAEQVEDLGRKFRAHFTDAPDHFGTTGSHLLALAVVAYYRLVRFEARRVSTAALTTVDERERWALDAHISVVRLSCADDQLGFAMSSPAHDSWAWDIKIDEALKVVSVFWTA
jgi:hypothetical protein